MEQNFPSKVINSPEFWPVLKRVFSYHAAVYDLDAYEKIMPGYGKAIWDLIVATKGLVEAESRFNRPSIFERVFGS